MVTMYNKGSFDNGWKILRIVFPLQDGGKKNAVQSGGKINANADSKLPYSVKHDRTAANPLFWALQRF